jgi:hypothetical protein
MWHSPFVDVADELNVFGIDQGIDVLFKIAPFGARQLRRDTERHFCCPRQRNSRRRSFIRRKAAQKCKITARRKDPAEANPWHSSEPIRARKRLTLILGNRNERRGRKPGDHVRQCRRIETICSVVRNGTPRRVNNGKSVQLV